MKTDLVAGWEAIYKSTVFKDNKTIFDPDRSGIFAPSGVSIAGASKFEGKPDQVVNLYNLITEKKVGSVTFGPNEPEKKKLYQAPNYPVEGILLLVRPDNQGLAAICGGVLLLVFSLKGEKIANNLTHFEKMVNWIKNPS